MRQAHDVAAVRAAEAALMARLPDGRVDGASRGRPGGHLRRLLDRVYGTQCRVARRARVTTAATRSSPARCWLGGAQSSPPSCSGRARTSAGSRHCVRPVVGSATPCRARDCRPRSRRHRRHRGERRAAPDAAAAVGAIGPQATVSRSTSRAESMPTPAKSTGAAVHAHVTVTFGTWKPGLLIDPGAQYAGAVELVDIGLGPDLPTASITALQAADVGALLPSPSPESDKYRRGVLGIVAGSDTYTGAAVLATGGALRAGAGMVRFVSVAHPAELVRARWPEAVVTVLSGQPDDDVLAVGRVQAWVVGPGIGTDAYAEHLLAQVLSV